MPEEGYEAGIVYNIFANLGLKITTSPFGYKWRDQAWVGAFESRQAAVRAAFADAIHAMKERDTMRREIEGLQAWKVVAERTINKLKSIGMIEESEESVE